MYTAYLSNENNMFDYEIAAVFTWIYLTPSKLLNKLANHGWYGINIDSTLPILAPLLNCIKNSTGLRFDDEDELDI